MGSKTIKVSDENYKKLLKIMSIIQERKGEKASFDDAINDLTAKAENIMSFAGVWSDMTDEEAEKFLDSTYNQRKIKSRRLN